MAFWVGTWIKVFCLSLMKFKAFRAITFLLMSTGFKLSESRQISINLVTYFFLGHPVHCYSLATNTFIFRKNPLKTYFLSYSIFYLNILFRNWTRWSGQQRDGKAALSRRPQRLVAPLFQPLPRSSISTSSSPPLSLILHS